MERSVWSKNRETRRSVGPSAGRSGAFVCSAIKSWIVFKSRAAQRVAPYLVAASASEWTARDLTQSTRWLAATNRWQRRRAQKITYRTYIQNASGGVEFKHRS